jgi:NAD(P)-dependent dehydrogenase (short-subunit alcohol dehydrogenase family)
MSQKQRLQDKVAVITGGSSGIGKSTALAFAREGAKVVLGARRTDEGEGVARLIRDEGGEAIFVKTDVTDPAQVEALVQTAVDTYGGLDIAFNNAGTEGDQLAPVVEDTAENFKRILDVNVLGVWHAMRAQIPHLIKRGGGSIINNSSVAGRRGFGGFSAYAASKFAVEGLSRSAAQELAAAKVRVNTVAPGPIKTALLDRATGGDHDAFVNFVPMGRAGSADEVAATVTFLASDAASYITSQSLAIDGGMLP